MAANFQVKLPEFPITPRKFDEYLTILNDPEAAAQLPLEDLYQMQGEIKQYQQERVKMRERLASQGLSAEQIAQVEAAQRASDVDPNAAGMPEAIRQAPQRDLTGIGEGARQAVEGVADLAMDLSVSLGLDSEQERQQWKASVARDRTQRRVEQVQALGQLPGPVSETIGQIVPWMIAGTGSAANYINFIARNAFLGSAAASTLMQPSDKTLLDRQANALWGASFGGLFGAAFAIPSMAKRAGARNIVRAFNEAEPQQRELVELLVREMTGNQNFQFSAAELTGSRFYMNLELSTADRLTKAAQNEKIDTLWNAVKGMATAQGASGKTAMEIVRGLRGTLKEARDSIYQQASSNWGRASTAIVRKYGQEAIIDGRAYLSKLDELIAEQQNVRLNVGQKPSENLLRYRNEVDKLVNPNEARIYQTDKGEWRIVVRDRRNNTELKVLGDTSSEESRAKMFADAQLRAKNMNEAFGGPTSDETLDILKGLNNLIGGKAAIFEDASPTSNRNMGRALMGVFTDTMEANPSNPEAVAAIKALREGYRMDMAAAQALDESVFGVVFGRKKLPTNPGKRLDAVLTGEYGDLVQLREFLEEYNPELLNELRATHLSRIAEKSVSPNRPHVDTPVDLNKLAKNLADSFGRSGLAGNGLHTPQTQRDMLLTAEALRVLATKQFRGVQVGGLRPEEWSINLISRSPEFFGRFLTRMFASGQSLEKALLEPQWRTAVRKIAEGDINSRAGKGALLYLATWLKESELERAQAERRAQEVEAAQNASELLMKQGGPL